MRASASSSRPPTGGRPRGCWRPRACATPCATGWRKCPSSAPGCTACRASWLGSCGRWTRPARSFWLRPTPTPASRAWCRRRTCRASCRRCTTSSVLGSQKDNGRRRSMKLGSLLTAMVTPFKPDGALDAVQAARLARHLVDIGNEGVVVAGTTGESPTLTDEEKLELFRAVVSEVGGRATVVAGTGTNDTRHSVELTKEAEKLGVDAIMAVVPYYNRPPQEGLYEHFKAIAESTSLPVMLYNIPSRTGAGLAPETMARLAEIDNVAAIKDSSGDLAYVSELRRRTPEDFLIYSGDDALTLPILAVGGAGVVSVAGHLVGREIKSMISAFLAGRVGDALEIHLKLMPLFKAMFITTNPVPVKRALEFVGVDTGPLRLPLVDLTEQEAQKIKEVLFSVGLGS